LPRPSKTTHAPASKSTAKANFLSKNLVFSGKTPPFSLSKQPLLTSICFSIVYADVLKECEKQKLEKLQKPSHFCRENVAHLKALTTKR
jgi:hypothetical protein